MSVSSAAAIEAGASAVAADGPRPATTRPRTLARVGTCLQALSARPEVPLLALVATATWLVVAGRAGWADLSSTAAAHVGARSWWALLWGATDPAGSAAVGLPAPTWLAAASVALLGPGRMSVLVPQALVVGGTVALVHAALIRFLPRIDAFAATLLLVTSPLLVVVATTSGPGALLLASTTVAPLAAWRAGRRGRARWAAVAGAALGVGFLSAGVWALLVVPACVVALALAPTPRRGRARALVVGGVATAASAGWWPGLLALFPSHAPWGLGAQVRDQLLTPLRLISAGFAAGPGAWESAFASGTDSDLGWGFALLAVVAVALGVGGTLCLWWGRLVTDLDGGPTGGHTSGGGLLARALVVVASWILPPAVALIALGAGGATTAGATSALGRAGAITAAPLVAPLVLLAALGWEAIRIQRRSAGVARWHALAGGLLVVVLLVPSAQTALSGASASRSGREATEGVLVPNATLISMAQTDADSFTWVAATVGGEQAGTLQLAIGAPVMTVGGVSGTQDVPSLAQFEALVAAGKVHYWVEPIGTGTTGTAASAGGTASGTGASGAAGAIGQWVSDNATCDEVGSALVCDLSGRAD